jgi:hypothetical protein
VRREKHRYAAPRRERAGEDLASIGDRLDHTEDSARDQSRRQPARTVRPPRDKDRSVGEQEGAVIAD